MKLGVGILVERQSTQTVDFQIDPYPLFVTHKRKSPEGWGSEWLNYQALEA